MKFLDLIYETEDRLIKKIEPFHPILRNTIVTLVLFLLGLPGYLAVNALIGIENAPSLDSGLEEKIPFLPWTVSIYDWVYVIIFLPIFTVRDVGLIRAASKAFLFGIFVSLVFFIFLPMKIERPVIPKPENFMDWWLWINYTIDRPTTLFPSMHVSNAILTALVILPWAKKRGTAALIGALTISFTTLTIRQHFIADVIGGFLLALISYRIFLYPYVKKTASMKKEEVLLPPFYALTVPAGGLGATFILYCIYLILK